MGSGKKKQEMEIAGYRGEVLERLLKVGVQEGDTILLEKPGLNLQGILIPRAEIGADTQHIIIKMKNGYNIGVRVVPELSIKKIESGEDLTAQMPSLQMKVNPDLPTISIISTGGTIASRVDYKTGAVMAALSARDLYNVVPELGNIVNINADVLFSIFSENMDFPHLENLAEAV